MTAEPDILMLALNTAAEEHTPQMIDAIIAYLRKHRGNFEAGVKPKKVEDVDVSSVLGQIKPKITIVPGKRRF